MEYTICNVCGQEDTRICNGDCEACVECGSIEQGFRWVDENGDDV